MDITLAMGRTRLVAHRPDCPMVARLRDEGKPLLTMLGCENNLPPDVKRHSCMEKDDAVEVS
jgi:hypothetical protein